MDNLCKLTLTKWDGTLLEQWVVSYDTRDDAAIGREVREEMYDLSFGNSQQLLIQEVAAEIRNAKERK